MTITRVLVANRGEIARRVVRSLRSADIASIVVYSDVDADLPFVREADVTVRIGEGPTATSYLDAEQIIEIALSTGADAIHPGYGFFAENAEFAASVEEHGLIWIGPSPDTIRSMGDKATAKHLMSKAGVPMVRGSAGAVDSDAAAIAVADEIGYPVIVKPSLGGGGIGMSIAHDDAQLAAAVAQGMRVSERLYGGAGLLIEQYLAKARHVEVQIVGDGAGGVLAIGDRDCSLQRRHQKVVEESPAPSLPSAVREELATAAARAGRAVNYRGVGTVEFLVEGGRVAFLEMNTRLQVEHPVTELVTGLDLVAIQLAIADGSADLSAWDAEIEGHAIEARVCAEDPSSFIPRPGQIDEWVEPRGEGIRVDSGYVGGNRVSPYYDSLLAKVCAWGETREEARCRLVNALRELHISGIVTNVPAVLASIESDDFAAVRHHTASFVELAQVKQ